jgi:uncharacterized protein YdeI (YjbR/CyaY-like superfamily)
MAKFNQWRDEFPDKKNLCLYYWLEKKIGKKCVSNAIERIILIFGSEVMFYFNKNRMLAEQQE